MRTFLLTILTGALLQAPFKPVATVRQIMTLMTIPASDVIFDAASVEPKNDAAWQSVQDNAITLAESGNLMMLPGRARDNKEWAKESRAMIDAAIAASNAARAKNPDQLMDASDKIYNTCESCHNKYMDKSN